MPCACDAAYPDPDDCPRCSAPVTVDDLLLPRTETPEQKARKRQVFDRIASDSRQLQAELAERDDEREAAGDGPWFERRPCLITQKLRFDDVQTAMPQLPDGPDDLLTELAEMEAVVERERRVLDDSSGARRCRYCSEPIAPGPAPGVHPECLPAQLPEGARSCTGCAELLLSPEDEFEHDFCEAEYEQLLDDEGEELFGTLAPPFGVEEIAWSPFGEADDDPTEPMFAMPAPDAVASDVVRCSCGRRNTFNFSAPNDGHLARTVSAQSVRCACGTLITVAFSWARRCSVAVKLGDADPRTLTN